MAEKGIKARYFSNSPSPAEFAAVEDGNVPAVFAGCVKSWPAFQLWNPRNGGLQRLKLLAGSATVQVMATTSGANFYGNIRGHDRVPLPFQSFLDLADRGEVDRSSNDEFAFLESPGVQLYLAQAGIEDDASSASAAPLSALREDLAIPSFLRLPVSAINLWMSVNGSRSSTHYDPFHNLLCVVSGTKEVKLWPTSAAPELHPLSIFGEASNRSGVDFANPNLTKYPRFHSAMRSFQSVIIRADDALFLPEGWYHQVDSEAVTIAVNLWWSSNVSSKLGTHMDAYLLRRLLANLLDTEKENIVESFQRSFSRDVAVAEPQAAELKQPVTDASATVGGDAARIPAEDYCASKRTNAEMQALRTLILCVVETVIVYESESQNQASVDPIAKVFVSLDPPSLQRVLLVMSVEYPRTLETLILHKLSPLACEILTRKFEEMDAASELDCPQEEFYARVYSVYDDPRLAMTSSVEGKEALAAVALERVLDGNLGLSSFQVHARSL